ncbi:MAG: cytochrome c-type biogenesis protein CcmH [Thiotrichales bacterium]|jgi:cytochrome c-type biogenesis protein CcmH|nr:cytochrome c-type biogenesis protein CcmH [Thiotrichales bacterium]MBT4653897.1 cytochrome c-type biogenesis protein CcmH [Thiotrichales bacterium]MBT5984328.1 cytochrome c-type biogenesis protein CcmH [Thiotrichales bacterium]MBT6770857.1 cytochrome c-type biogenesis protein CcmH [Thiotrichales bacterium]MBT7149880.1 cytochrome c-type biogenesis protein CcmH [Thiotrichales bacterium]
MRYFIHFVIGLLLIQAPFAESIKVSEFETTNQQSRYTYLIENIRCPVCQGQSIGGSNSELAKDLRDKVREMIIGNQSDSDIYLFMVERYGDFVVYKPPVSPKTYLLWFAPILALLLSLIYLFRSTRKKTEHEVISPSEIEKAKKLLK